VKGARALASGMLVLASICAVPALAAAQDAGTTTATTTTTTTPADPAVPTDPGGSPGSAPAAPRGQGAGTPGEAPDQTRTADTPLADSPPATGSAGGGAKARKAASASVTMGDFFFSPASVTVAVGDTVTWHNTGQAPHTATADDGSFDTGTINAGGSGSHTFSSAGTFSYICTIHPNMKGTVRVLSSSGGSGGTAGSSSGGTSSSESSAVASPNAAGTSTTLPMTGMAVGGLALVGLALLGSGFLVRRARDHGRRWLSIF
jgi:LPXTG-motif cell wall-anchored protein